MNGLSVSWLGVVGSVPVHAAVVPTVATRFAPTTNRRYHAPDCRPTGPGRARSDAARADSGLGGYPSCPRGDPHQGRECDRRGGQAGSASLQRTRRRGSVAATRARLSCKYRWSRGQLATAITCCHPAPEEAWVLGRGLRYPIPMRADATRDIQVGSTSSKKRVRGRRNFGSPLTA
jgi:hypothetical protein